MQYRKRGFPWHSNLRHPALIWLKAWSWHWYHRLIKVAYVKKAHQKDLDRYSACAVLHVHLCYTRDEAASYCTTSKQSCRPRSRGRPVLIGGPDTNKEKKWTVNTYTIEGWLNEWLTNDKSDLSWGNKLMYIWLNRVLIEQTAIHMYTLANTLLYTAGHQHSMHT